MIRCKIDGRMTGKKRDRWAKIVTGVDRSAKGGWAIEGEFCDLNTEMELQEGAVVVRCDYASDVFVFVVEEGANDSHCLNLRLVSDEEENDWLSLRKSLPSLLDRIEGALSRTNPRDRAMDEIRRLMTEHGITTDDLVTESGN